MLTIHLLGSFEVRVGTTAPTLRRKTRAMLAYLAATGQRQHRRALADMFCQETKNPYASLRSLLSRIRRQVGSEVLLTEGEMVRFNGQAAWVDCLELARVLESNLDQQRVETLTEALQLYRGEFLEGLSLPKAPEFELWLLGERTRLRNLYERGLGALVARLIALAQYKQAIPWAQQLVQSNALLEEAHGHLIWLYAQTGQREAALAQFEQCRNLLALELAVEPTPELQALHDQVHSGQLRQPPRSLVLSPHRSLAPSPARSFVGRERELAQLHEAWQAIGQGKNQVLLLEAEAGGGKTRLVNEFAAMLPKALFLAGDCYESTRALPYSPWIELLEGALESLNDSTLSQLPAFWLDYLIYLLPPLASRLGGRLPPTPPTSESEVQRLFSAITEFLRLLPAPLLLFIDNLQWADELSLRLFHFVARRLRKAPLLLIGAFRTEEVAQTPALAALLSDLRRQPLLHLRLPPLTSEAISKLMVDQSASPPLAVMLAKATGGNPFFVTEVLQELTDTTQMPTILPVPPSVRELIASRLRRLPEHGRQVIEAVAVIGKPVTRLEVQLTSARSQDETVHAIDLALRRCFLKVQSESSPISYDFNHDLVREAVASQLSHMRRQLLHRRAATMLIRQANRLQPAQREKIAGRITYHANAGENWQQMLRWAPVAALEAHQLGAYSDALTFYQQAFTAWEQLTLLPDEPPFRSSPQQAITLLLKQIELLQLMGRDEQEALLERTRQLLAQQPEPHLQASFDLHWMTYLQQIDQWEQAFKVGQLTIEAYMRLGDKHGAATCLSRMGRIKLSMGQSRDASQLLEEALALHRLANHATQASGDQIQESRALMILALCLANLGEIERALAHLARACQIAELHGDPYSRCYAYYVLGNAWCFYYEASQIENFARKCLQLAQEAELVDLVPRARLLLAAAYHAAGDLSTGQSLYEQAFAEAQSIGLTWVMGWAAQNLGKLSLQEGHLAKARHWLQEAYHLRQKDAVQNLIYSLGWMGRLNLAEKQPARAQHYTSQAMQYISELAGQTFALEQWDIILCHAEALSASGDDQQAAAVTQQAYDCLINFAAQINDPAVKQTFLASPSCKRVMAAKKTVESR